MLFRSVDGYVHAPTPSVKFVEEEVQSLKKQGSFQRTMSKGGLARTASTTPAARVRAAITPLAIVRPVRCVLRARRQIIAYSRQWSFAHIATLVARYLLKQLHLRLRRNHRASVPRPRLRSHLFAIFCLINSGLLLGLAWLVVSDVDQCPFNYLFYWLTLCFL